MGAEGACEPLYVADGACEGGARYSIFLVFMSTKVHILTKRKAGASSLRPHTLVA